MKNAWKPRSLKIVVLLISTHVSSHWQPREKGAPVSLEEKQFGGRKLLFLGMCRFRFLSEASWETVTFTLYFLMLLSFFISYSIPTNSNKSHWSYSDDEFIKVIKNRRCDLWQGNSLQLQNLFQSRKDQMLGRQGCFCVEGSFGLHLCDTHNPIKKARRSCFRFLLLSISLNTESRLAGQWECNTKLSIISWRIRDL